MKGLLKKTRAAIAEICLVDRFLILFMFILMLYTSIGLFAGRNGSDKPYMVDTIVRTSAASIFGYFISSNFTGSGRSDKSTGPYNNNPDFTEERNVNNTQPNNQIGFSASYDTEKSGYGRASVTEHPSGAAHSCKHQVVIVSSVGICSLILLFVIKFFAPTISETTAVISQLRDFVSACIGFLVSCGHAE